MFGGGQAVSGGTDICAASRLFAVPVSNRVHIFDLSSCSLADVLHLPYKVTSVRFGDAAGDKLFIASQEGTLEVWSVSSGTRESRVQIGQHVVSLVVAAAMLHMSVRWGDRSGRVRFMDTASHKLVEATIRVGSANSLKANTRGDIVATHDGHRVLAWRGSDPGKQPVVLHHTKAFECVAISAEEERLAAGDVTGRILIWQNFSALITAAATGPDQQAVQPAVTTLHWHAQPVRSLAFTADSLSLLSGGDEGVLVSWRLAARACSFLSHLGRSILEVQPAGRDEPSFVLACNDNSFHKVNISTGEVTEVAAGVVPRPQAVRSAAVSRSAVGQLALAGEGATLQLYDAAHNQSVQRLQVASRTLPPGVKDRTLVSLQHVAFSADSQHMVTVDCVQEAGSPDQAVDTLKFWYRANRDDAFALSTAVQQPHQGTVTAVVFHPSERVVASAGTDGQVRLWTASSAAGKAVVWRCSTQLQQKGGGVGALAFSSDGSLLAVAAPDHLALWEARSCTLLTELPHLSSSGAPATSLLFVEDTPFLVALDRESEGQRSVTAWDVTTLSVMWTTNMPVTSIAATRGFRGLFAATACSSGRSSGKTSAVLQLDPSTGNPIAAWQVDASSPQVLDLGSSQQEAEVVASVGIVDRLRAYEVLHLPSSETPLPNAASERTTRKSATVAAARGSALTDVFGSVTSKPAAASAVPAMGGATVAASSRDRGSDPLAMPSHLLPPMHTLLRAQLARLCAA